MLYIEFIKGTNCRDNEHNYKVYKMIPKTVLDFTRDYPNNVELVPEKHYIYEEIAHD